LIDNVAAAYCFPLAQGLGTVDVVVIANKTNTGSEIPSSHNTLMGSITSVQTDKLIDTGATFVTSGVTKGDPVTNAAGIETTVSSVDSETHLALVDDIFTALPDTYTVTSLTVTVKTYIDTVRPVTAAAVRCLPPTIHSQAVTMAVAGVSVNTAQITADIAAYMDTLIPGQTLYLSQLTAIAVADGASNAIISTPAADVTATSYQMIRPGVISVS
jgi:uncharacterized phage protein gp47/JayE